jgi:hypothetical protein
MGQAKLRKAEIKAQKSMGPKIKSTMNGFLPDAGLNSNEGTNHYWFQVSELVMTLKQNGACRTYEFEGDRWAEINCPVDIMDYAGNIHTRPQQKDGYFATFRFTSQLIDELADQIDLGAMSVRITGVPKETATAPSGERFRVIEVQNSWSAGNNSNFMMYMIMSPGGPVQSTSKEMAQKFRNLAQMMRADKVAA